MGGIKDAIGGGGKEGSKWETIDPFAAEEPQGQKGWGPSSPGVYGTGPEMPGEPDVFAPGGASQGTMDAMTLQAVQRPQEEPTVGLTPELQGSDPQAMSQVQMMDILKLMGGQG